MLGGRLAHKSSQSEKNVCNAQNLSAKSVKKTREQATTVKDFEKI